MARVLLLQPPIFAHQRHRYCLPQGLLSISAFLRQAGHDARVVVMDHALASSVDNWNDLSRDELYERAAGYLAEVMEDYRPTILGLGPFTAEYPFSLFLTERAKKLDPNLKVILGGPHVTYQAAECLTLAPWVDMVCHGEGEWTLLDLADRLDKGLDPRGAEGLSVRKDDGTIAATPARASGDLATLPTVDFGELPSDFVREAWVPIVFSRGCPYTCTFCVEAVLWGQKVRFYDIQRILNEVEHLVKNYDVKFLALQDSIFNARKSFMQEICDGLRDRKLEAGAYCHLRTDGMTDWVARSLKETGIIQFVSFGIESASSKVLAAMNKRTSWSQAERALDLTHKYGFGVHTLWIIGHPGDTPEEFKISHDCMESLYQGGFHDGLDCSPFYPYPGTGFFEEKKRHGIRMLTDDLEDYKSGTQVICELDSFSRDEQQKYLDRVFEMKQRYEPLVAMAQATREAAVEEDV